MTEIGQNFDVKVFKNNITQENPEFPPPNNTMDVKPNHGCTAGEPRLIKLCRSISALIEKMGIKIKKKQQRTVQRAMPQRKRKLSYDDYDENGNRIEFEDSSIVCGICFESKSEFEIFRRSECKHCFCTECISDWVASELKTNIHKVIGCPQPSCRTIFKPEFFETILPQEVLVKWESATIESSIPASQKNYCPYNNCSVLLVNDAEQVEIVSECPSCHRLFCANCMVPWHVNMNCKQYQKSMNGGSEKYLEKKFLNLARSKTWRRCPRCNIYVEKQSGCKNILCRCGNTFCYSCGKTT